MASCVPLDLGNFFAKKYNEMNTYINISHMYKKYMRRSFFSFYKFKKVKLHYRYVCIVWLFPGLYTTK